MPAEERHTRLCSELARILDRLGTMQPLQIVALGVEDVRTQSLVAVLDAPLSDDAREMLQQLCAADSRLNPTRCAMACMERRAAIEWPCEARTPN